MTITLSIDCARELLKALGLELESEKWWAVTDAGVVVTLGELIQALQYLESNSFEDLMQPAPGSWVGFSPWHGGPATWPKYDSEGHIIPKDKTK